MGEHTPADPMQTMPERFDTIHTLERWWLRAGVVMLVVFFTIITADAVRNATMHSHGSRSIDPDKVASTAPFNRPGTYRRADGTYDAVVVSYAFGFLPKKDLVVPEDTVVRFHVVSLDVVHGFTIPGHSNVNLEVLPGHISEVTQTFDEPGRYLILCNEYCGSGHHFMTAHIRVLKRGEDPMHPPPLDGTPDVNGAAAAAAIDDAMESMDHEEKTRS